MILRHPVSNKVISHIQESHCTHLKKSDARKRALQKRLYSAKETYHFQEPANRSHPISHIWRTQIQIATTLVPCRTSERWVTHVTTRDSRGRSDSKHLELQICQFSRHFFEWRGLRLLTWKPAWNFGDSRENVFDMYANSRENLLEVLAVVIIWSQMSSDCGHTSEECVTHSNHSHVMSHIGDICDTPHVTHLRESMHTSEKMIHISRMATVSRTDKIIVLFCKRTLWKRRYSAKETYNFIDPTDRSHPICLNMYACIYTCLYIYIYAYMHAPTGIFGYTITHLHTCIKVHTHTHIRMFVCPHTYLYTRGTGWRRPIGALSCRSFFAKEPLIIGLFAQNDLHRWSILT